MYVAGPARPNTIALFNTAKDAAGVSPYFKRYDKEFDGHRLPLGVGVFHFLNRTKYKYQHKFESRLCYGIPVGYVLNPGSEWSGMCSVMDLDNFVDGNLHDVPEAGEFARMQQPHYTKQIMVEPEGLRFPFRPKSRRANPTLEGREEYYNEI